MSSSLAAVPKQLSRSEILSNVHHAMRLLTSALEALSLEREDSAPTVLGTRLQRLGPSAATEAAVEIPPAKYVVFDFETNGIGKTSKLRVCQIGAAAMDENFTIIDRFTHFVNPLAKVEAGARKVHGLDQDFVNKFDSWEIVGSNFMKWLDLLRNADQDQPLTLMAHNGKRFDARILVSENARHKIELPRNLFHCDTIDVMKTLFPGKNSYALGRMYSEVIGVPLPDAHDAAADVAGVIEILKRGHPGSLAKAITEHKESFNLIIKRALSSSSINNI